jgi:hypothetical protein
MVWRDRHTMKYIGYVSGAFTLTNKGETKPHKKVNFRIMFFMSESGKREIELPKLKDNPAWEDWDQSLMAMQWMKGGPFPTNFIPETDTLGPMLRKIVDIKMGLTEGGDNEA